MEAVGLQLAEELGISGWNQHTIVHADAVRGVAFGCAYDDAFVTLKLRMAGKLFDEHEGVVAKVGDAALEMENAGHVAYVDDRRGVAEAIEISGELAETFFIAALRETKKEMGSGFADVATVERARRLNLETSWKESSDLFANGGDFAGTAGRAGTRKDGGWRSKNGSIFDESRIGMSHVGRQGDDFKPASGESFTILHVLAQSGGEVGHAEVGAGEAVGEIASGDTDDGVLKHAANSPWTF